MTVFVCPYCDFEVQVIDGTTEVKHRCPKRLRKPRWVKLKEKR